MPLGAGSFFVKIFFRRPRMILLFTWGIFAGLAPGQTLLAQICYPNILSSVSTFAGTGTAGYTGDGGPATSAKIRGAYSVAVDQNGNVYIAEYANHVVREVAAATGIITTFAGNGISGYTGDGGAATSAELESPTFMAFDSFGNLYIADFTTYAVRKVTPAGIISTYAGNGINGYTGDGGAATSAELNPFCLAVDPSNNLFITNPDQSVVRKVTAATGIISTFAGTGINGYSGDGGPAVNAHFAAPEGIAIDDSTGNVYVWDDINYRIRMINSCGIVNTVAGTGVHGNIGDGGPALSAEFSDAEGLAFLNGSLYTTDWSTDRVRVINSCNIVNSIGGTGTGPLGTFGDTALIIPEGIAFDAAGDLYVAEYSASIVIKVAPNCSPTPTPACAVNPISTFSCNVTPAPTLTFTSTPTSSSTSTPTITPSMTPTNTPTVTATFTIYLTSTNTATATPTNTCTITPTISPTPTFTPTCVTYVWPDPYSPKTAVGNSLRVSCMNAQTTVNIYTISGELVQTLDPSTACQVPDMWGMVYCWNGRNKKGFFVSSGIYIYVVDQNNQDIQRGKFLMINGS